MVLGNNLSLSLSDFMNEKLRNFCAKLKKTFKFFLGGHVTSYYGAEMQKYTSFQVHPTEPVRQIEFVENGILCLTDSSLRFQLRRGIPKQTHRSKSMLNTHCMLRISPEKLLIGGHQDQLIEFDLTTFTETSSVSFLMYFLDALKICSWSKINWDKFSNLKFKK